MKNHIIAIILGATLTTVLAPAQAATSPARAEVLAKWSASSHQHHKSGSISPKHKRKG